jgi:hypothetical protein
MPAGKPVGLAFVETPGGRAVGMWRIHNKVMAESVKVAADIRSQPVVPRNYRSHDCISSSRRWRSTFRFGERMSHK